MILLKHGDRNRGQEELHCKCGSDRFTELGEREFPKRLSQVTGGLANVKLRLFPLVKH